jgi:hypothetical protein
MVISIPFLGIYPREFKSGYNKDTCTPMFTVALFRTSSKIWEQLRCPKMMNALKNVVFIYNGILFSHKEG